MISPTLKLLKGKWLSTTSPSFERKFGYILLPVPIYVELTEGDVCAYMKDGTKVKDTSANATRLDDNKGSFIKKRNLINITHGPYLVVVS
jgi:putative IMPACT (imprinted ancient) family translation regulator